MRRDFRTVTELAGSLESREELERIYTRYHFAVKYCEGKDVLEVACGCGQGIGYLARAARSVVGGDIDAYNLGIAREQYRRRDGVSLCLLDAHRLPFGDGCFDVVILYEAIYYLAHPENFLAECRRVLSNNGTLLICTVNRNWPGFCRSPFSTRYFSGPELYDLLTGGGFHVELFAGFLDSPGSAKERIVSVVRRMAASLRLIPKTMKGKRLLKRLFFGKLSPLKGEIVDGMAKYCPPTPVPVDSPATRYKVLYAVGRVR